MECVYFFLALALVVYLLPIVGAVIMAYEKNQERDRRNTLAEARLAEAIERREAARELREARLAAAQNKVVQSDQAIELQQLKIRELKQKLGDTDTPFTPTDYPA